MRNVAITTNRPDDILPPFGTDITGIEPSPCNIFEIYQRRVRISDDEDTQRAVRKYFIGYLVNLLHQVEAKKGVRC